MPKAKSFILGEYFDSYVTSQVDAGRYASVSEVIREGLRLVERSDRQMETMDAAIQLGLDSGIDEDVLGKSLKPRAKQSLKSPNLPDP